MVFSTVFLNDLFHFACQFVRTAALPIIADVVLEVDLILGHILLNDRMGCGVVPLQHHVQRLLICLFAKPLAEILDANLTELT